jgi:hypothetical protein
MAAKLAQALDGPLCFHRIQRSFFSSADILVALRCFLWSCGTGCREVIGEVESKVSGNPGK